MIRHAGRRPAGPVLLPLRLVAAILALAVAVIETAFRALLVPPVGRAPLLPAGLRAASRAAITLAMIATGAEKKQCAAPFGVT